MIKRHIIETMEEFDEHGKLISRVTTDTTEEDDSPESKYITLPYTPQKIVESVPVSPWWSTTPYAPYVPSVTTNGENMMYVNTPGDFIAGINKALSNSTLSIKNKGE